MPLIYRGIDSGCLLLSIMRLLKTHPILGLLNSYMVDSPQPANLSYM